MTLHDYIDKIKTLLRTAKTTFDFWNHKMAMTVVFGISLSSFIFALVGACIILALTIGFTNGYLMIIPETFPHLYKAMPAWLGR